MTHLDNRKWCTTGFTLAQLRHTARVCLTAPAEFASFGVAHSDEPAQRVYNQHVRSVWKLTTGAHSTMLPPESTYQFTPDLRICRLLNGLWQVSGGHGRIDPATAIDEMIGYHDAGFTTWDLADHYGPAEDFIGEFRRRLAARSGPESLNAMQAFTKWVPSPGPMTRQVVERAVDVSRRRMNTETLDLMQFHWWDYRDQRYLDALEQLAALRASGKIRHLGLTNFDTERLEDHACNGACRSSRTRCSTRWSIRPEVADGAVLPGARGGSVHLRHAAGRTAVGALS